MIRTSGRAADLQLPALAARLLRDLLLAGAVARLRYRASCSAPCSSSSAASADSVACRPADGVFGPHGRAGCQGVSCSPSWRSRSSLRSSCGLPPWVFLAARCGTLMVGAGYELLSDGASDRNPDWRWLTLALLRGRARGVVGVGCRRLRGRRRSRCNRAAGRPARPPRDARGRPGWHRVRLPCRAVSRADGRLPRLDATSGPMSRPRGSPAAALPGQHLDRRLRRLLRRVELRSTQDVASDQPEEDLGRAGRRHRGDLRRRRRAQGLCSRSARLDRRARDRRNSRDHRTGRRPRRVPVFKRDAGVKDSSGLLPGPRRNPRPHRQPALLRRRRCSATCCWPA